MKELSSFLAQQRQDHLYRHRRVVDGPQSVEIKVDGKEYVSFCSNDYLGLASHPQLVKAMQQGAERYGVGSGASHLITGHSHAHHALEQELAEFTGRQRALLFSTGYMANLGTVAALLDRHDSVFEDKLNHASLIDAGRLSDARLLRYAHADIGSLSSQLDSSDASTKLIVTDGVFSMDGDLAPLPELVKVSQQHNAMLMVDDAHGLGVIGKHGGGSPEHFGLDSDQVPILVGTLGKAFGTFGAFVAGSDDLIETLIQKARSYIYTTALPPAVAEATRAALQLVKTESWRREHLTRLIERFRNGAAQQGLALMPSSTPIQPLVVGEAEQAMAVSNALLDKGFLITAIRPPTVPDGSARLRITLSAAHSEDHVDRLLEALAAVTRDVCTHEPLREFSQ